MAWPWYCPGTGHQHVLWPGGSLWPVRGNYLCDLLLFPLRSSLPDSTIQCFCDNLGVINTLTGLQNNDIICPNDTTNDDRDIYLAIQASAACYPQLSFQFLHVLGHQDAKPDHPLTIEEQHNVECDALTKHIVQTHHLCSTMLDNLAFKAASPHLYINS